MAARSKPTRLTATRDRDIVVFLIGMRISRLRSVRQWVPVFLAMPRMIRELMRDQSSGLLGARTFVSGRTVLVVQYWDSYDQLATYASDAGRLHRPAWTAFNRRAAARPDVVGIYHETYAVAPDRFETIYAGMPPTLLGAAVGAEPVGPRSERSRDRMSGPA